MLYHRLLYCAKQPCIPVIGFSVLIFYFCANRSTVNISPQSIGSEIKQVSDVLQEKSYLHRILINFIPSASRKKKGIGSSRKELMKFESSDTMNKEFHSRVLKFFDRKCKVQFFMTWFSPPMSFGGKEFVSLGSLFKAHPDGRLMILSKSMGSEQGFRILKPLVDLGFKIAAVTPHVTFLLNNTPAEAWFDELKKGRKDPAKFQFFRIYQALSESQLCISMEVFTWIHRKSFTALKNSVGAQSFDSLLFKFMEDFVSNFDGNIWGYNGPYLISRVVEKVAGLSGYNFSVLPPMAFYPVDWKNIGRYFKKPENLTSSRWVNDTLHQLNVNSFGLHLWNRISRKFNIEEGNVLARLIKDHCIICQFS